MQNIRNFIGQANTWEAIHHIVLMAGNKRSALTNAEWRHYVDTEIRGSELMAFAQQCPFTRRSFERPRGYAGDAVMMDYIYGIPGSIDSSGLDDIAEEIYRYTTNAPAPRAVRYRRKLLARYIDDACACKDGGATRILSVACGHLREMELSQRMRLTHSNEFFAFDQDAESLKIVDAHYGRFGVTTQRGSIRELVAGRRRFEAASFDLVYSAGLYDYLSEPVARKLTARLFDAVASGGKLLLANFLPNIPDVGYMEGFMDWWLTYRSAEQMHGLLRDIQPGDIARHATFEDPAHNIVFLEVERK